MKKINLRIILLFVVIFLYLQSTTYGIEVCEKLCLRKQLDFDGGSIRYPDGTNFRYWSTMIIRSKLERANRPLYRALWLNKDELIKIMKTIDEKEKIEEVKGKTWWATTEESAIKYALNIRNDYPHKCDGRNLYVINADVSNAEKDIDLPLGIWVEENYITWGNARIRNVEIKHIRFSLELPSRTANLLAELKEVYDSI